MKKRKNIGVDFDDVLLDFNGTVHIFHNEKYGTNLVREEIRSYRLDSFWGCSPEETLTRLIDFFDSKYHVNAAPIGGAQENTKYLAQGHSFHIITARPQQASSATASWLKEHFPHIANSLHFTDVFDSKEKKRTKRDVCEELAINIFIDDALHHIEDVAPVVERAFLLDAPWNQKYDKELPPNVTRVYSWDEIAREIDTLL